MSVQAETALQLLSCKLDRKLLYSQFGFFDLMACRPLSYPCRRTAEVAGGMRKGGSILFPPLKDINPKVKVKVQQEFELSDFTAAGPALLAIIPSRLPPTPLLLYTLN